MYENRSPKWVLADNKIVIAKVVSHSDIKTTGHKTGGGWWYKIGEKHLLLYSKSIAFGGITDKQFKDAEIPALGNIDTVFFSHEDNLLDALRAVEAGFTIKKTA